MSLTVSTSSGNWTPVIVGGTTPGTGTYSQQFGRWTRIGNLVHIRGYLTLSNHTGSGTAYISGLPFTASSASNPGIGQVNGADWGLTSGEKAEILAVASTTTAKMRTFSGSTSGNLPVSDLAMGSFSFDMWYECEEESATEL